MNLRSNSFFPLALLRWRDAAPVRGRSLGVARTGPLGQRFIDPVSPATVLLMQAGLVFPGAQRPAQVFG